MLSLIGPEAYQGNTLSTYITAFVLSLTSIVWIASFIKFLAMQTFDTIIAWGAVDVSRIALHLMQTFFVYWLPYFLERVFPLTATSAYLLSINI